MLTTLKDVLTRAREDHYAVPAFDCTEDVMLRAVLETCEAIRAPAIIMFLTMDLVTDEGNGWFYQTGLLKAVADRHDIPIVMHLDHATDLETVRKAVDFGFTSIMVDGSQLPFDENVRLTREAVELAAPAGISVEAELGYVGGMDLYDKECFDNVLTEPDEVARFTEQTGVDALAVSIGTSHGVYRSLPNLNIERLRELDQTSPVPLVLHGGSGTPDDQIRAAIENGICKMNIFADLRVGMARGWRSAAGQEERVDPLPREMFGPIKRELAKVVVEKSELLGSVGKA